MRSPADTSTADPRTTPRRGQVFGMAVLLVLALVLAWVWWSWSVERTTAEGVHVAQYSLLLAAAALLASRWGGRAMGVVMALAWVGVALDLVGFAQPIPYAGLIVVVALAHLVLGVVAGATWARAVAALLAVVSVVGWGLIL